MNETELRIKSVEIASAMGIDVGEVIKMAEAIFEFISRRGGNL